MSQTTISVEVCVGRMGADIGRIWAHLWSECLSLNTAWGEFETLFANRDNFEAFNAEAPQFFAHLQGLMIQDLVVRVARMVDRSSRQTNLSLYALRAKLAPGACAAINSEFLNLEAHSNPVVALRNKLYAHKDLPVTLRTPAKPLPDLNRVQMNAVIKSVNKIMDDVDQLYGGGATAWSFNSGEASRRLLARLKAKSNR
jgi:AbiU2